MTRNRSSGRSFTLPTAPWGTLPTDNKFNNSAAEPAMPSANYSPARAQPARYMPAVPPARPAAQRNRNAPRASQRLTGECQRRSFNPEWILAQTANGWFRCDVKLLRHIVKGGRVFRSPEAAKSAVASKALDTIRTWPTTAQIAGEDCREHIVGVLANRHHARVRGSTSSEEQVAMAAAVTSRMRDNMPAAPASRERNVDLIANPIAARVCVKGLAGGLSAQQQRVRSRSPGPVPRGAGDYRQRSPPGFVWASPAQSTVRHSPAASETPWAGVLDNRRASQPAWRRSDSYRPSYPHVPEEQVRDQFGQ